MVELVWALRRTYGISRSQEADMLEELVISKELEVEAGVDVASAALRYRQGIADFISAAAERSGASAPSTERPQGSTPRRCWSNQRLERSRASDLAGLPAERTTADPAGGRSNERTATARDLAPPTYRAGRFAGSCSTPAAGKPPARNCAPGRQRPWRLRKARRSGETGQPAEPDKRSARSSTSSARRAFSASSRNDAATELRASATTSSIDRSSASFTAM